MPQTLIRVRIAIYYDGIRRMITAKRRYFDQFNTQMDLSAQYLDGGVVTAIDRHHGRRGDPRVLRGLAHQEIRRLFLLRSVAGNREARRQTKGKTANRLGRNDE